MATTQDRAVVYLPISMRRAELERRFRDRSWSIVRDHQGQAKRWRGVWQEKKAPAEGAPGPS